MKPQPNQTEIKISIWDRLKLETPKFWKKIGVLGGAAVAFAGGLQLLIEKYSITFLPDSICGYIAVGGFVAITLAPLAVKTPPDSSIQKPKTTADSDDL